MCVAIPGRVTEIDGMTAKVDFNGNLTTKAGVIGVSLTIDSKEKRLNGQISTKASRVI